MATLKQWWWLLRGRCIRCGGTPLPMPRLYNIGIRMASVYCHSCRKELDAIRAREI